MLKRYPRRPVARHSVIAMASATDQLNRPLGVLRLSLTARCNLACPYCLPDGVEPPGLLTPEQRLRVIGAAVSLGARSLRLTGGEPLLHGGLEELIATVQPLRATHPERPGLREIALTSNGLLLSAERAQQLHAAGLDRITLSLDGTTAGSVAHMAGLADAAAGERALAAVLAAIEHARAAGFDPARGALKLNAVIQRGANDDQVLPLAALARERGLELRLIEFMDVGSRNGWQSEAVLSAAEMLEQIGGSWPLEPLALPGWGRKPGGGGIGECTFLRRLQPSAGYRRWRRVLLPFCRPGQRLGSQTMAAGGVRRRKTRVSHGQPLESTKRPL